MQTDTDEHWMQMALDVARSKGSDPSTSPLGCVIVLDGRVIAAERNQTKELPDATAHAEMMAIRWACEQTGELELRGRRYTRHSSPAACARWHRSGRKSAASFTVLVATMFIRCISRQSTSTLSASSGTPIGTISRSRVAACATRALNSITVPMLT